MFKLTNQRTGLIYLHPSLTHNDINRIEPPNWWVDFESKNLQLLINHPNISEAIPQIDYKGVSIHKVHKADSPNYLFIDLIIDESTLPGVFDIVFNQSNKEDLIQSYELKAENKSRQLTIRVLTVRM